MQSISIIIPVRKGGNSYTTLKSLAPQLRAGIDITIVHDSEERGANWARNRGAQMTTGELLLFSDDDIEWQPGAIALLEAKLAELPCIAYAYGPYEMSGRVQCDTPFNPVRLKRGNFISTMSLIRREVFPGFDESIQRLQDWDLWLTMLARGHHGSGVDRLIFKTLERPGLTLDGPVSWEDAKRIVATKHGLL